MMSAVAVVLGVAFVAGSFIFTDTLGKSFTSIMTSSVGDVVVSPKTAADASYGISTETIPASVVAQLAKVPGAARADGGTSATIRPSSSPRTALIGGRGAPGIGVNHNGAPSAVAISPTSSRRGQMPTTDGEIVLDSRTAKTGSYAVGDTVPSSLPGPGRRCSRSSWASSSRAARSSARASSSGPRTRPRPHQGGEDVASTTCGSPRRTARHRRSFATPSPKVLRAGLEAKTGHDAGQEAANSIQKSLSFITNFLLIFAAVALIVGSFIIVNTFRSSSRSG